MERPFKLVIQAYVNAPDSEVIGMKEAVSDALELMGCEVEYINVMPNLSEDSNESY